MENNMFQELLVIMKAQEKSQLMLCNDYTEVYGLQLSEDQVTELVEYQSDALLRHKRFEFAGGILEQLVRGICTSSWVHQDNYLETLEELLDVFYEFRNLRGPEVGDQEILDLIVERFEDFSQGVSEYIGEDDYFRMEDLMDWREELYQKELNALEGGN